MNALNSINNFGLLIIYVLIGMLLVAHLTWWLGRKYFPNVRICALVHKNLHRWFNNAWKLLTTKPQNVQLVGFFATLLWPCLVFLNVLLLAQVMGVFFPGGQRIPLPFVGVYSVFPLIMGFLYAASQMSFGVIHGHSKTRTGKVFFVVIIIFTVLVEMGLAYYRARVLSAGEDIISPTMWDKIILEAGPGLAALIGFIVPIAEITSGYFAFFRFIEPIVPAALRWLGGLLGLISGFITWLYLGFHSEPPIIIIGSVGQLLLGIEQLTKKVGTLRADITRLQDDELKLGRIPNDFDDLKISVAHIKDELAEKRKTWNAHLQELTNQIDNCRELPTLLKIEHALRDLRDDITQHMGRIRMEAESLATCIEKHPQEIDDWNELITAFGKKRQQCESEVKQIQAVCDDLRALAVDIYAVWNEQERPDPILTPAQVKELQELQRDAMRPSDPIKRNWALRILNNCQPNVRQVLKARIPNINGSLSNYLGHLNGYAKDYGTLNNLHRPLPADTVLATTVAETDALEEMIPQSQKDYSQDLHNLDKNIKAKRKKFKKKPRWLAFLYGLFGFNQPPLAPTVGL